MVTSIIRQARNSWRVGRVIWSRFMGGDPPYLPVLLLFLIDRCNLRCVMCGVCDRESHREVPELTAAEWLGVLDSAKRLGTMLVSISGGEPMLRRDLEEIIAGAAERGMRVHMCSNGLLMTPKRVRALADAGLRAVSISIDHLEPEGHEALRGRGTWARTLKGVQTLREHAPEIRVSINTLITRENYEILPEMLTFARELGVHQVKFMPVHAHMLHKGMPPGSEERLFFRPEDLPALEKAMARLREACARSGMLTTSPGFLKKVARVYEGPIPHSCFAGYAVAAVTATGDVSACLDKAGVFNVRNAPLHEMWRSRAFHEARREVRACSTPCWDTTNAELSLKLNPVTAVADWWHLWWAFRFYLGGLE
ncbi:MAG TPA: radical SAM protein [Candidatus Hydrogenedentes bacterium]|nr:radical SAM protein [Candidatus Hydrogenedentota bacterium]